MSARARRRHTVSRRMRVDRKYDAKTEHQRLFEAVDKVPWPAGWTGDVSVKVVSGKATEFVTIKETEHP